CSHSDSSSLKTRRRLPRRRRCICIGLAILSMGCAGRHRPPTTPSAAWMGADKDPEHGWAECPNRVESGHIATTSPALFIVHTTRTTVREKDLLGRLSPYGHQRAISRIACHVFTTAVSPQRRWNSGNHNGSSLRVVGRAVTSRKIEPPLTPRPAAPL